MAAERSKCSVERAPDGVHGDKQDAPGGGDVGGNVPAAMEEGCECGLSTKSLERIGGLDIH